MVVTIDIGHPTDIHPKNKQDVGGRLAQWALAEEYGQDIVPSGPLYKSMAVEGSAIRLSFDHVGQGLMAGKKTILKPYDPIQELTPDALKRFAIAGADRVWHWADAKVDGDTVVVSSPVVTAPIAVRYAYSMNPEGANLYNKDGLPASPFRTDTW
jgi:sialate O-acetylesterase